MSLIFNQLFGQTIGASAGHVRDYVDVTVSMYSIFNHLIVQTIMGTSARVLLSPVKRKGHVYNAIALVAHARDYVDIDITVSMIFNHLFRQTILEPVKESYRLVKGNGPVCNTDSDIDGSRS